MNQYIIIARYSYAYVKGSPFHPHGELFATTLHIQHLIMSGASSSGNSYFYHQYHPLLKCITNIISEAPEDICLDQVVRDQHEFIKASNRILLIGDVD